MPTSFSPTIGYGGEMLLPPDEPAGRPSLALTGDEVATVVDLACRGIQEARIYVTAGMLEVPITRVVRKAMRRVKQRLSGLTNLEIHGEQELDDMATNDPAVLGRVEITLKFLHQFGDEDAYFGIESKRLGAGLHQLNKRYVTEGVDRFVSGQYAKGHPWGMMLGYVLALPVGQSVKSIDGYIRQAYGEAAKLQPAPSHELALAVLLGSLVQGGSTHVIRILHVFVDMTVAARA